MNKKTLRIAGWALGLSMAVAGIGIAVGASAKAPIETKADSLVAGTNQKLYTYDFSSKPTANSDNTFNGVTWTAGTATNLGSYNSGNYKGVQLGTSTATGSITFNTKSAWGAQASTTWTDYTVVKKVAVWLNNGSGTISASVSVGGTACSSTGTVTKNSSATSQRNGTSEVVYTPASGHDTGVITIALSTSSKAGYFCSFQVLCEKPSVNVTGSSSVRVGNTITLESDVAGVSWSSSDDSKATVNSSGVVTGVAEGDVTIYASKSGYVTGSKDIHVEAAASDPTVDLDVTSVSGFSNNGTEYELNATATAFSGDVTWNWVVIESTTGVIDYDWEDDYFYFTLVKGGTATITVTATYGDSEEDSAECSVTVTQSSITALELNKSALSLYTGMSETLTADLTEYGYPTSGQKAVTWVSSTPAVADVTNGVVRGVAAGNATITAFIDLDGDGALDVGEVNDTCTVTVTAINTYTKLTAAENIYAGMKVVIGCEAEDEVVTTDPTSSNKYFATASASISNGVLGSNNALVFTIGGTVDNWTLTSSGDYLVQGDSSKNLVLSSGTSTWTISFSNGDANITSTGGASYGQLRRNSSLSRVKPYAIGGQTAIQLFEKEPENNTYSFIRNYMRMGDSSLKGNGSGACKDSGYYADAKLHFNTDLSADERAAFFSSSAYTAAAARLNAWAEANHESFDATEKVLKARSFSPIVTIGENEDKTIIPIIGLLSGGLLAAGGFVLVARKRKEDH